MITADNGIDYVRFVIAVERDFKKEGEPKADFLPCIACRNKAFFLRDNFCKGMLVTVAGRLEYTSMLAEDGKTRIPQSEFRVINFYRDGFGKENLAKARRRAAALKPGEPVPKICEQFLHPSEPDSAQQEDPVSEPQDDQLPD